jgi:serine/threonine-protein kinase RsbW
MPGWHGYDVGCMCEAPPVLDAVVAAMRAHGYSPRDCFGMRLCLEEALVNAVRHGNKEDPSKRVAVRYRVTQDGAVVEVEDEGPGFDPDAVPDPLAPENLEKPSGRGLLLMRHYLTSVDFNRKGNCVTLRRCRSA